MSQINLPLKCQRSLKIFRPPHLPHLTCFASFFLLSFYNILLSLPSSFSPSPLASILIYSTSRGFILVATVSGWKPLTFTSQSQHGSFKPQKPQLIFTEQASVVEVRDGCRSFEQLMNHFVPSEKCESQAWVILVNNWGHIWRCLSILIPKSFPSSCSLFSWQLHFLIPPLALVTMEMSHIRGGL